MTTITYTRKNTWQFLDANGASELTESGIEGMIGDYRDTSTQTPGIPGQQVTAQDVSPMEGTLKAFIEGDESRNAGEVWAAFRADFVRARHLDPGKLTITTRYGTYTTEVYLNGTISIGDYNPEEEDLLEVTVPIVSDKGYFWGQEQEVTKGATIANTGDLTIYPRIHWNGDGGAVTSPSGWNFTLPAVPSERILYLDPLENLAVLDTRGRPDYEAMDALELTAVSEGVPPGQKRRFILPPGAAAKFSQCYLDPWAKR